MPKALRHTAKAAILFAIGAGIYAGIEIAWRGHTHWTMAVLGGLLFLAIGGINNFLPWEMSLLLQGCIGTVIVTAAELAAGIILNIWLNLGIWDYSQLPGNFYGQICPQFALAWFFLSLFGIILDDYIRHWLWNEPKPHYTFF